MSEPMKIVVFPDDVEIEYFDEDPDGEPDRAGDGHYFRIEGDDSWSGPWHSEEEAEREARDHLFETEKRVIVKDAMNAGWICIDNSDERVCLLNKIDDRWFEIDVNFEKKIVNARERLVGESSLFNEPFDSEADQADWEEFGHAQARLHQAIEAVQNQLSSTLKP